MYLYDWDGKALKESGALEGLRGVVSALAISPDGSLLAAGDVSVLSLKFNSIQLMIACSLLARSSCSISRNERYAFPYHIQESRTHIPNIMTLLHADCHFPMVFPQRANQLAFVDRRWSTLCLRFARHAHLYLERAEAYQEHRDQERSTWWRQCSILGSW